MCKNAVQNNRLLFNISATTEIDAQKHALSQHNSHEAVQHDRLLTAI
jgi:hypothetical protein